MSKFKVGDKIESTNPLCYEIGEVVFVDENDETVPYLVYNSKIQNSHAGFGRIDKKSPYWGHCAWIGTLAKLVEPRREFIVIRRDGAKTIAELRHDREVIKSGKAICNTSDTFDFETGAKIALDRLMGREEPKPEPQPAPDTKYFNHSKNFELRSKFKIDDRVTRDGKTGKVVGHERDSHDWVWVLFDGDSRPFPNLEHFLSPAPAPKAEPKLYTGKVKLVKSCGCYECDHIIGKVFEISEGKFTGFVGAWGQPFSSFSDFVSKRHNKNWIEVKD